RAVPRGRALDQAGQLRGADRAARGPAGRIRDRPRSGLATSRRPAHRPRRGTARPARTKAAGPTQAEGLAPTASDRRGPRAGFLVDVGPVPVPLEDDLAAVAAEHDLHVPPADCLGIAAADGARGGLLHV